jgi:hypothetical protein
MTDTQEHHGWTEKQERLLKKWAEKAAGYRWLHNNARLIFKRQHDWLSYPTIIMSSITGVGGFAMLTPSRENNGDIKLRVLIIQYFFAFMNVASGIINSISKFNNCSQTMELHSLMCVQYSKFYRNIDMELSIDPKDRNAPIDFVKKSRIEYDRLLSEGPDIPSQSIHAFNRHFPHRKEKPDVCNGLSVILHEPPSPAPNALYSFFSILKKPSGTLTEINTI